MSHLRKLREILVAKQLSDDDELDDANAVVVCNHSLLLDVMNCLGEHDALGLRIRFDPEKDQDSKRHRYGNLRNLRQDL